MRKIAACDVLNRLVALHYRSLPMYVIDAAPWTHRGDEKALSTLSRIVADQRQMAGRIAEWIIDHHRRVDTGEFPMEFTALNDCSLDYLVGRLVQAQKADIAVIERCVVLLDPEPVARGLAEEALGAARGHLESLEETYREVQTHH